MARPPDMEKRSEIAQAAYAYLRGQGPRRVTMSELARALEMKRPTLYWYFSDLASIFEAVLDELFEEQDQYVAEAIQGVSHPVDLVYAYIQAVHAFYDGREEEIVFMFQFWAAGRPDEPARAMQRIKGRYLPRRKLAVEMLAAGQEAGQVAPCDPEAVIGLVGAMIDGLLIQRLVAGADLDPIHDMIWTQVLEPLKIDPRPTQEHP